MKQFDRYSIRGIIFSTIAFAGIAYEIIADKKIEPFLIILYGVIVILGFFLIFKITEK